MAKKKKEQEIIENYNDYIIAVDISMTDSGVAVYSVSKGEIVYIDNCNTESVRNLKKYRGYSQNAIKLNLHKEFFEDIKRRFPPRLVIFERGFSRFKNEVAALNQVNGVIFSIFWDVSHILYPPKTIKAEIIHGDANKKIVRDVLMENIPEVRESKLFYENDNVSDAVGVLATYLLKHGFYKKSEWSKKQYVKKVPVVVHKKTAKNNELY